MKSRNLKISFFFKLGLTLSSLVLLIIILTLLIFFLESVFDPSIYVIRQVVITLLIATLIFVTVFATLTINDYRSFFDRKNYIKQGRSYLSLTDIFDNENRLKILTQILSNPGIHHNELQRICELQKGQLQWHLKTLLKNNIIKKEKHGQYSIYFPITSSSEAISTYKNRLPKSKTTNFVLDTIIKNPGITSAEISRMLNLSRNSIKYHIDKLLKKHLIKLEKKGRTFELYSSYP
ncbi:MAG TPA: winged helix-turn-helix transcriptional regulator [Candidatus Nanopelagicaceae bacterium]|nr:winged helix-turn-helix transcriptional regulator [Candidatus Nanopelagicaceae bacterium]